MLKIVTFVMRNGLESIPNDSRISPEPFRSNFHIIFALGPQNRRFSIKSSKQVQKYGQNLAGSERSMNGNDKIEFSVHACLHRHWSCKVH